MGQARERGWRDDWGRDLDSQGLFDDLDHALLRRAVRQHTESPWVRLSIARGLKAPVQRPDGTLVTREQGTPQGGVVSPLLANLCWHYPVEVGRHRPHPAIPFERDAEEAVCHGHTEEPAPRVRQELEPRCAAGRREWHPQKPTSVSGKDDDRRGSDPHERFDLLG
ncbi:MAG TPA: hypothetical protein VKJ47_24780 [Candidatus Binatia bacterium]|nr:hypothetical protein [Candidatus Binatia bacterium]